MMDCNHNLFFYIIYCCSFKSYKSVSQLKIGKMDLVTNFSKFSVPLLNINKYFDWNDMVEDGLRCRVLRSDVVSDSTIVLYQENRNLRRDERYETYLL